MNQKTCCIIGLRWIEQSELYYVLKELLTQMVQAAEDGYTHFILGVLPGLDLMAAGILQDLQAQHPLTFELVCAYQMQLERRKPHIKEVLQHATQVTVLQEHYHVQSLKQRDVFVVERSGRVIAVHNNQKKDAALSALNHAYALQKEVHLIVVT